MIQQNLIQFLSEKIHLNTSEIEFFIKRGEIKPINKKRYFIKEGQRARYKGYIINGCTRTFYRDANLKENIIFFSFEGEWLGDIESYHLNKPSRVSIQAIEDCEIMIWTKTTFDEITLEIPKLQRWYDYTAVNMYSNIFDKLIESKIRNPEEKYKYLLKEHREMLLRVPAQYIADYLEIAPQSFSRLRKRLREKE